MSNNKRERRAARRAQAEAESRGRVYQRESAEQMRLKKEQMLRVAITKQKEQEREHRIDPWHWAASAMRRAPKLNNPKFRNLFDLMRKHEPWTRPLEDWKPKGKSATTQIKSLVRHLLVKYPIPEFLYDALLDDNDEIRSLGDKLLLHLGRGGSMYAAVTSKSVAPGVSAPPMVPVPLTKRMCHEFVTTSSEFNLIRAIRRAQVVVYGGDRRLLLAVCESRLGLHLDEHETLWASVLQWLCQQTMLAPTQVGPIIDWLRNAYLNLPIADRKNFTMKGRTAVSVIREVERWHGELALAKATGNESFLPSGLVPLFEEKKVKLPGGAHYMEPWAIIELLSSRELLEEGKRLKHCVYSYTHSIRSERSAIWSLRVSGSRVLTIEVDRPTRRIVQVRGSCNRLPTEHEMVFIRRWATANNLTTSSVR